MADKCWICKDRDATKVGMVEFSYRGLKVRMFKNGGSCQQCVEDDFANRFEKFSHLLKYEKEKIIAINWRGFCKECDKRKEVEVVETFLNLGIFSLCPAGNWEIVSDSHIPLNPKFSVDVVYFTNFTDAVHYAKEKFLQTQYAWYLRQIEISYSKNQLLKLGHLDRNEINFSFVE